jgi:hypothetical protein
LIGPAIAFALIPACADMGVSGRAWTSLFDGKSLSNWNQIGDANWRVEGGMIVADKGNGFLVTRESYGDFEIRVEFYAEADTNSGIYFRCQDSQKLVNANCQEANIFDTRPKPEYGTGALTDLTKVDPMPKAGGRWNDYVVTARGEQLTVVLNGVKTAEGRDTRFKGGLIGLQHGVGAKDDRSPIKFRKVEIRPL